MRYVTAIVLMLSVFALGLAPMPAVAGGDKAPSAAVHEKEQKLTMDQLPAPVKATIEKEAAGGTIGEIVRDTEKGKMFYEAQITKNGKDRYVHVADDGKVLKRESAKKEAKEEAKEDKRELKQERKAERPMTR
jgi:uncharacterized membrane protein YkoI